jgi:hypothetical protein
MKKIIALGLAAAGVLWVRSRSSKTAPANTWAQASDAV